MGTLQNMAEAHAYRMEILEGSLTDEQRDLINNPQLPQVDGYVEISYGQDRVYKRLSDGELFLSDLTPVYKTEEDKLSVLKEEKIGKSKIDLATYLSVHPILWTDGAYYSITAEKQAQLTGKITAATIAKTMSKPYTLTWNSTGEVCKIWTLQDLSALAFAIDARVTALVTYQQTQEVSMRNAETQEALDAIVVDYSTVPVPALPEADQ